MCEVQGTKLDFYSCDKVPKYRLRANSSNDRPPKERTCAHLSKLFAQSSRLGRFGYRGRKGKWALARTGSGGSRSLAIKIAGDPPSATYSGALYEKYSGTTTLVLGIRIPRKPPRNSLASVYSLDSLDSLDCRPESWVLLYSFQSLGDCVSSRCCPSLFVPTGRLVRFGSSSSVPLLDSIYDSTTRSL